MCGICGWYGNGDPTVVLRMLHSIDHRGPDGSEVWSNGRHSLGAARLEIIGGKTAVQPWIDKENGIALVFNGEIYNCGELRNNLERNEYRHKTDSEVEVIANLYRHHGLIFPSMLRGMFAVAVLDLRENRLVFARDPLGIKPLYYWNHNGKMAFSSEIKGLLRIGAPAKFDMSALEGLMTFGYVFQQNRTLFDGIRQVCPGTVLVFDGRDVRESRYYIMPTVIDEGMHIVDKSDELHQTAEQVRRCLEEAIQTQVDHGDQRKAFYLSGGVDSSFMVALAATAMNKDITAYTLADDPSSEDLLFARQVAEAINVEHREIPVNFQTLLKAIPDYIHHYEQVVAGGVFDLYGGVAFHILSQEISRNHKVAFSGEGADELFGGYYWTYTHPLGFADRIRERLRSIQANGEVEAAVAALFPQPEDAAIYRRNLLDWLMRGGLSNYHLSSVDRSCGAFGFEIRPVYLDHPLVDYALRLPIQLKIGDDGRKTKLILKEAARPLFQKLGLESVLTRRKLGMPWAVRNLAMRMADWAEEHINDNHLNTHPYRRFLPGKVEAAMFDLFYHIFMARGGSLEDEFDISEFFKAGDHERLYS